MSDMLLDYSLNKPAVTNPDGSYAINFAGCTIVAGPGATAFGQFDQALDFGTAGKGAVVLTNLKANPKRFAIAWCFRLALLLRIAKIWWSPTGSRFPCF